MNAVYVIVAHHVHDNIYNIFPYCRYSGIEKLFAFVGKKPVRILPGNMLKACI